MEVEFRVLKETKIAILGMGLMGGSLALALRGKCKWVLGIDHDANTLRYAQQQKMVDFTEQEPGEKFREADVIVLALPVCKIIEVIEQIPGLHPGPALVLDLGSTKAEICTAMENLPAGIDAVGGHPMCGKEKLTIYNADNALYQGATFALTRLGRTTEAGLQMALKIVAAAGATELLIDPETHDQWVAATSHFPYLLSNVLAASTAEEFAPLVGSGWRSSARLADTPPSMMMDVLATNRENVLETVRAFKDELSVFEQALAAGEMDKMENLLNEAKGRYEELA